MKNDNEKEDKLDMIARIIANGFEQLGKQMIALDNRVTDIQTEMHTGFSDIRLEIRDLNRRVESLEQKISGVRESLDETVLKSEFIELKNKVLALEAHFA